MKKRHNYTLITLTFLLLTFQVSAENHQHQHKHQHGHQASVDNRISLNLPPMMKQHQLENMRAHLKAVQDIVGLIANKDFKQASDIAHQQLGMSTSMAQMCGRIENEEFKALGMAFHQSGDELGDVLLTEDTTAALGALNKTMNYCVHCHAQYRQ